MKFGWFLAEAVVWYVFLYYFLFVIKNDTNLWTSSVILVVLAYLGMYLCPWFRETDAYKRMMKKKR